MFFAAVTFIRIGSLIVVKRDEKIELEMLFDLENTLLRKRYAL